MMTFVNMDSDGLVILPTHRVVHSLRGFDPAAFAKRRRAVLHRRKTVRASDAASYIDTLQPASGNSLRRRHPRRAHSCCAPSPMPLQPPWPHLPENQRQLDLSHLHTIILDQPARPRRGKGPRADQHPLSSRRRRSSRPGARGEADVAFLTNPVTMEQLREVAFAGSVMPQKSTDFYPKLLSGLAIYALE